MSSATLNPSTMSDSTQSFEGMSSRRAMEDPSSPYFLHHSITPGTPLVSQTLTEENYASWSRAMTISLSAKNKMGFVDGTIPKPNDEDLVGSWERNNNIVMSWILNSISKEISASIIYCSTASEMWLDLRDRFQQESGAKLFQLKQELINHKQDTKSVSTYFTKLKTIWEEINSFRPMCNCNKCICGGKKSMENYMQNEYTMSFLMGLNENYAPIRSQILLSEPLPSINKAFALILQEEQQKGISNENQDTATTSPMACSVKAQNRENRKNRPICSHCQIPGHTQEKCYKIHGYPPGHQRKPSGHTSHRNKGRSPNNDQEDRNSNNSRTERQDPLQNLDKNQLQRLVAMLSDHLGAQNTTNESHTTREFTGKSEQEDDWQG